MTTRVELLNRALLSIGADPILGEEEPGAEVHLAVYDRMLAYITVHEWTFFEATEKLVRLAAAPVRQWTYAYQLPSGRLGGPQAIYDRADGGVPSTAWDLVGDQIVTDMQECWWKGSKLRDPGFWPGDFTEGFTTLLMSTLALSVREDAPLARELRVQALGTPQEMNLGGLIGMAYRADKGRRPSRRLAGGTNPFATARG